MGRLSSNQRQAILDEMGNLRRFCFSLTGHAADADDLLQQTIEKILDRGAPEDAHMGKWSFTVCKNIWLDEIRAREVRKRHLKSSSGEETGYSTEAEVSTDQELDMLLAALNNLPVDQRLALVLVAVEGKSYSEASQILDVAIGTIMSRVSRARKQLEEQLRLDC